MFGDSITSDPAKKIKKRVHVGADDATDEFEQFSSCLPFISLLAHGPFEFEDCSKKDEERKKYNREYP